MNGSRTLKVDSDKAIKEMLSVKNHNHTPAQCTIEICNMTNWIENTILVNKYAIISELEKLGFTKSLRREATHYAIIDNSNHIWLNLNK